MKRNRLFLIIATLAALDCTTSCSQDHDIAVPDGEHRTPISFNVGIGSVATPKVETRGYTTTQAVGGYTFANGDKIAISLCGVSGSSRATTETNAETKLYSVPSTGVGSKTLSFDGYGFDWMGTSEVVSVRAWGFGDNTTTATDPSGQTFTISTTQNTDDNTHELLYSPATNYTTGSIPVPLYHQLARVVVNVKGTLSTATDASAITINSVDIGDSNLPITATFARPASDTYNTWKYESSNYKKISDSSTRTGVDAALYGTWSSHGTANQTIHAKQETTPTSGYTATYSAVVLPNTYGNASGDAVKFIVINTSNGTYAYNIAANSTITLNSGKQYTFNITDLNQIDLNVTVSAWTADATNSQTVTFE